MNAEISEDSSSDAAATLTGHFAASELRAGDIAACVGLKDVTTCDTLTDPNAVITLERMEFPDPVISLAIEPKTKSDQDKLAIARECPGTR